MTEQRPEVVAAALALAREVSLYAEMFTDERARTRQWPDRIMPLVLAYRAAVAPKRSRAERDAHLVRVVLAAMPAEKWEELGLLAIADLCGEETAPEPAEGPLDIGFPDPEPCSCDEALALKERIAQALAHIEHVELHRYNRCVWKAVEILKQ